MKKLNIASTLTNISDQYIEEAREMPLAENTAYIPPRRTFWQKLSHAINSPVGVACICAIVAFGVLSGIIAAGQNPSANPNPPAGLPVDTHAQLEHDSNIHIDPSDTKVPETEDEKTPNHVIDKSFDFDFSFEIDAMGVFKRGQTYNITTSVTNVGEAFTYTGSSTEFFAEARLVYHSGQTYAFEEAIGYEIQGVFAITEDWVENKNVPTGTKGQNTGQFFIPDSAPVGQYDLKISYKNEYIIYENAVSIYDEERFAFAYEGIDHFPDGNVYNVGGSITLTASVTNLGDAFMVYEDHSDSFVPTVKFVCRATGYTFYATTSQSDDITTFEVAKGQVGKTFYFADIPEDADAGVYDLVLSYSNESRTFYEVIQIIRWKESEDTTPLETTPVPEYNPAPISSEVEALEAAKAYIQAQNMKLPTDLENLRCDAYYNRNSQVYWITFGYDLADISTDYDLQITINHDGVITDVRESSWDENSYFMVYTEKDVQAAIDRITDTRDGALYFEEEDGKLFVCKEVIVSLTPPPPDVAVTDEEGNGYVQSGCGIDHDHVFYKEEVRHETPEG